MNKAIRHWLLALSLLCVMPAWAINYSAEYFWNEDPGVGRATKIATRDVTNGRLTASLDASTLPPGMHVLGVRVFNGKWSPTVTNFVFVPAPEAAAITRGVCEYFWDQDPGIDSGTKINFATNGEGPVNLRLNADGLAPGMHILGMRTLVAGVWGPTSTSFVFVPAPEAAAITEGLCEYFWDTDPGVNEGRQLTFATNGEGPVHLSLNAEGLTPGMHILGTRTRVAGQWGPTTTSYVFVAPPAAGAITEGLCEYFWDEDPGVDCGQQLAFATNGSGQVALSIPAEGLPLGVHVLGMRTRILGQWGPTTFATVYVRDDRQSQIDYIEYFWGDDPGYGNGTRVMMTESAETVVLERLPLALPTDSVGDYILNVRPHNSLGYWGPTYSRLFSLAESVTMSIDTHELTIDALGDLVQITAEVDSDDPAWPRPVTWTSSDESVATVDATGVVKAIGKGTCVITAECRGADVYDECQVTVTASRLILHDATPYDFTEDQEGMKVTYRRTFETDNWQPLYVPFAMSHDEWIEYAEVAELAGVHMYDDGRTVIEFLTVHSGEIMPHVPYVIKPRGKGTVDFYCPNRTVYAAPTEVDWISCSSPRWTYSLYGTYTGRNDMESLGAYVLNDDCKLVHSAAPLAPYRFYMLRTKSDHGYWPRTLSVDDDDEIYIMVDGEIIDPSSVLIGDVNTDGKVTVSDIVSLVSHLLGSTPEIFDMKAADANGDAKLTVTDVVGIVDIILKGGASHAPARMALPSRREAADGMMYIPSMAIPAGGEAEVEVMLDTPGYDVSALQLCLQLPDGLSVKPRAAVCLTDRGTASHTVASAVRDGVCTVVAYSTSNAVLSDREGAVVRLTLVADPGFNGGQLRLYGIEAVEAGGETHRLGSATADVAAISGIANVGVDYGEVSYYSISGMRLPQAPATGPYIELRGTRATVVTRQ